MNKPSDAAMRPVTLDDIIDDKEFVEVIRNAMAPAIDALVYRTAMVAKQFALFSIQSRENK